ncbi:MAG: HDOD domain-containing protein [Pseudomonadota bacterium]
MSAAVAVQGTESLQEMITREISAADFHLPVFNQVAIKLQESLNDPDFSFQDLEALVLEDPSLVGQILKTANSAFYRGMGDITTVKQAILRLGSQQVASLAMLVSQKQCYASRTPEIRRRMEMLWEHSFASALGCEWIFNSLGGDGPLAFVCGLLHDIGKLGILKVIEQLQTGSEGALAFPVESVDEILASSLHVECGVVLARAWNLPEPFASVLRDHHGEAVGKQDQLLLAVRLMNLVSQSLGHSLESGEAVEPAASIEAQLLGLSEIRLAELEIHIEDALARAEF